MNLKLADVADGSPPTPPRGPGRWIPGKWVVKLEYGVGVGEGETSTTRGVGETRSFSFGFEYIYSRFCIADFWWNFRETILLGDLAHTQWIPVTTIVGKQQWSFWC